jgi:hypothetical protein
VSPSSSRVNSVAALQDTGSAKRAGYNPAVSSSRATFVALLVVLGVGVVLALAPFAVATLRLAGVALLWWYGVLVGPALAAGLLALCGRRAHRGESASPASPPPRPGKTTGPSGSARRAGRGRGGASALDIVAAWLAPVVLVTVAARVFTGSAEAPLLALGVAVVPLLALVTPPLRIASTNGPGALAGVVAIGLCVWANLLALGEVAVVLSIPRAPAVAAIAALALALTIHPALRHVRRPALVLGVVALMVPVAATALADGWPWKAWAAVASRPALTFGERSAGAREGRELAASTTLAFDESHRITALTPGLYRVLERDGDQLAIREWRLAAGDSLALRPGDHLSVPDRVRVRFERGKRVPGAAPSGVAWADPLARGERPVVPDWLGTLATMGLGALALAPGARSRAKSPARAARWAAAAPALTMAAALAAVCWGVYAVNAAVDGAVASVAVRPLFELGAGGVWGQRATGWLAGAALTVLFLASAWTLRDRLVDLAPAPSRGGASARAPLTVWAGVVSVAALLAAWPGDAWHLFLTGLGLGASALAAPALARVTRRAEAMGSFVGGAAFLGLLLGGAGLPEWAALLTSTPALLAAPLGWLAARVADALGA